MSGTPSIRWLDEPEEKDYQADESFLSMVLAPSSPSEVIAALHAAPHGALGRQGHPAGGGTAAAEAEGQRRGGREAQEGQGGIPISPILLVGGIRDYLVIGDGYHRASAAYRVDEDALVPGRLLWSSRAPRPSTGKRGT